MTEFEKKQLVLARHVAVEASAMREMIYNQTMMLIVVLMNVNSSRTSELQVLAEAVKSLNNSTVGIVSELGALNG